MPYRRIPNVVLGHTPTDPQGPCLCPGSPYRNTRVVVTSLPQHANASPLDHRLQEGILEYTNHIIYAFLWSKRKNKNDINCLIKYTRFCQLVQMCGVSVRDLHRFDVSLCNIGSSWRRRTLTAPGITFTCAPVRWTPGGSFTGPQLGKLAVSTLIGSSQTMG